MIPKINSSHGAETRNIINAAIDSINTQGKSIQDLVAEGQLTPAQYGQLISIVNGNISKGNVTVDDIDINQGKITQSMIADSLLRIMAGDAPVNATPPDGGVTTSKLADKAATADKRTPIGEFPIIYPGSSGANIDLVSVPASNLHLKFEGTMFFVHRGDRYTISENTVVDLTGHTTSARAILFNTENETFLTAATQTIGYNTDYNENIILLGVAYYLSQGNTWKLSIGTENYTLDGQKPVTTNRRSEIGELPFIYSGTNGSKINLDTISSNYNLTVSGSSMFMVHRNTRYQINDGTVIDLSTTNVAARYVFFNVSTEEFKVTNQQISYSLDGREDYILFAIAYLSGDEWKLLINSNDYTINGNPPYMPYNTQILNNPYNFSPEPFTPEVVKSELPGVGDADNPFDRNDDDWQKVYGLFDELMSEDPAMSREEIGVTERGNPHYVYHRRPERAPVRNRDLPEHYPTIIIDASVHGGESLSTDTVYWFAKILSESDDSNKTLEYLRNYINFIFIPLSNPEDYTDGAYTGLEGVNLNRDFDYRWSGTVDGAGSEPFTRVESRNLRDFFFNNSDAMLFINCHVRGGSSVPDDGLMWMAPSEDNQIPILTNTIEKMTRRWKKEHTGLRSVDGQLGYITTSLGNGVIKNYVHSVVGIYSILWEGFKSSPTITPLEGKDVVQMNVDYLIETVSNAINYYR